MKRLPALILTFLLVAAACSRRSDVVERLEAVADSVRANPQAALDSLAAIDSAGALPGSEEQALRAFIRTQAEYELYIEGDNDSVIDIATRYYDRHGASPRRLMLAHYLQGFIRNNANNHNAVVSLLKAEKYAKKLGDHRVLGLIYSTLATVYSNIFNFSDELDYSQKSLYEFEEYGDSIYLKEAWVNLCNAYNNVKDFHKSDSLATALLEHINFQNDSTLAARLNILKGIACLWHEQNDTAAIAFGRVYENTPDEFQAADVKRYLRVLYKSGQTAKADSLWPILKERYPEACAPEGMFLAKDDYKGAYYALADNYGALQLELSRLKNQQVQRSRVNYTDQQHLAAENRARRSRTALLWVMVLFVLLALAITAYLMARKRIAKRRETELMCQISGLANELANLKKTEADIDHNKVLALYGNSLEHLCEAFFTGSPIGNAKDESPIKHENISRDIAAQLHGVRKAMFSNDTLARSIDSGYSGLLQHLQTDIGPLSAKERDTFICIVLGLSPRSTSLISGDSVPTIYKRRSRLRLKIEELPPEKAAPYLRFFGK